MRRAWAVLALLSAAAADGRLAAQAPTELSAEGMVVLPSAARPGSGWRVAGAFPAAGAPGVSLQLAGGSWRSRVSRAGDPGVAIPITGEVRSSFLSASVGLTRAREGYLTSITGGVAAHLTRADLTRSPPVADEEVRAMEAEMEGFRMGPTAALTLVRRPLFRGRLNAELTLRRSWVGGIEPWELSAGLALPLRRAAPGPRAAPVSPLPAGAAPDVRRPPDALVVRLEAVALEGGFEVLDADDGWRAIVSGDAFPSAGSVLPAHAREALARMGALLARTDARVRVIGHTDHTGPERANQRLSERRALAVYDALLAGGLDPGRVSALGYGSAQPRAAGDTAAGRAANRRVEVVVSGG